MDQAHWRRLSDVRLVEAQALVVTGFPAGAYYLAGYAVECRLKALVVKLIRDNPSLIYVEQKFQAKVWTHNIQDLLQSLKIEDDRVQDCRTSVPLYKSWAAVFQWSEATRYGFPDQVKTQELLDAITDPSHGVIQWIDKHF